jgi:hypothetical protein
MPEIVHIEHDGTDAHGASSGRRTARQAAHSLLWKATAAAAAAVLLFIAGLVWVRRDSSASDAATEARLRQMRKTLASRTTEPRPGTAADAARRIMGGGHGRAEQERWLRPDDERGPSSE